MIQPGGFFAAGLSLAPHRGRHFAAGWEAGASHNATVAVLNDVYMALGAEATIEVLMLINRWSGLALMLNALDVDLDENARISIPTTHAGDHDH